MGAPSQSDGPPIGGAVLDVYEVGGGHWGWSYREPDDGFELQSNRRYATREEAVTSARRAYPDVPFAPEDQPAG